MKNLNSFMRKLFCYLLFASLSFSFQDMSKHWAKEKVEKLVKIGAIKGYDTNGDGIGDVFKPNGKVTRAEFLAILSRALNWVTPTKSNLPFSDVKKTGWYVPFIQNAYSLEIIPKQMVKKNHFFPNQTASRAEIASLIAPLFSEKSGAKLSFKDVAATHWAYTSIAIVADKSKVIVKGYPDGTFKPDRSVSRAEASVMVIRTLDKLTLNDQDRLYRKLTEKLIEQNLFEGYTGLILDCRNLPLQRSQAAFLFDNEKNIIYPSSKIGEKMTEIALDFGAFSYPKGIEAAKGRAGAKPLVITCMETSRAPGVKEGKPTCPVVSAADRQKIEEAIKKHDFFFTLRVAIVSSQE